MLRITDLKIPLDYDEEIIKKAAAEKLRISVADIESIRIARRSVDTRKKQNIHFIMTVVAKLKISEKKYILYGRKKGITEEIQEEYKIPESTLKERPVIVGCGPAGMFAALILAQAGAKPVLLERGCDVDSRKQSVNKFWNTGVLDTESNVQFGEGGAGTFSDGKLKIASSDSRQTKVLKEFVEAGAPEEILYSGKPHIGTDRLHEAVKNIRKKIIACGGEVRFNCTVTELLRNGGRVTGVGYSEKGIYNEIYTDNVILAVGHSARDTFERFYKSGIVFEQKPFAVGVRIEHLQEKINKIQYGSFAGHPALGAADYRMVVHLKNGRNVYNFCNCPGGTVVGAASEENGVVTNGMSEFARDGKNASTATYVTVNSGDLESEHPLAGMLYQRNIEKAAFIAGGGGYKAPVQRLGDFFNNKKTTAFGDVLPTYKPGTEFAALETYLPLYICDSLKQGFGEMGEWMRGFADPDAVLTGAETRSSSPVRITRGETLEAVGIKGLYPCGEGAGYAGGILSAAVDGIRCAEMILSK